MIFKTIILEKGSPLPRGAILARGHKIKGKKINKGTCLTPEVINRLIENNIFKITIATPENDDLNENEAAKLTATLISGENLTVYPSLRGRANIYANKTGLFKIDEDQLIAMNSIDDGISIATLPPFSPVRKGQLIATSKIIPFFLSNKTITRARETLQQKPCLNILPYSRKNILFIATHVSSQKPSTFKKAINSTLNRIKKLGLTIDNIIEIDHCEQEIIKELKKAKPKNYDCILIFPGLATSDQNDTLPFAIKEVGGKILRFGLPADPGNLTLIAEIGGVPILGLPGCAKSSRVNGFDWILERTLANCPPSRFEIAKMGIGGLLKEMPDRPEPREPRVRTPKSEPKKIAALLLAAGSSERMGQKNKLLEQISGKPMIIHVLEKISPLKLAQKTIVLGYQTEEIQKHLSSYDFNVVNNLDYKSGLSSSIKKGISSLNDNIDGVFIFLGDMPIVHEKTLTTLILEFQKDNQNTIFIPSWKGRRGNPVLLDKSLFGDLLNLEGDKGAQQVFSRNEDKIKLIDVNNSGVCLDIDTIEALQDFKDKYP